MKTKMIAIALMGIFASAAFAQDGAVPSTDQPAISEEAVTDASEAAGEKAVKEDPRADRAKERFERKEAKKAEIAAHKAEKEARKANK